MTDFDGSLDLELSVACNRLAAWVGPLPEGQVIDPASGLTERDLAMILRRLYATREYAPSKTATVGYPCHKEGAMGMIKWVDTHDGR